MCCTDLTDLVAAGVKWEIMEIPAAIGAAEKSAAAAAQKNATRPNDAGRVATMVVPPIAPVQSVSVATAAAMAARPNDLDALCRMIAEFGHPLRAAATNVVLPHVATKPNGLVIITDMPGIDDDATGKILAGAAGELLDKMLAAIGMSRECVSISPMLFWRTPGGRTPTAEEMALSRPFVNRFLEISSPRVILTLGTSAATEIAGANLSRAHGGVVTLAGGAVAVPIFHPNYLLLKPNAKRDVWVALQQVENLLKNA